MVRHVRANQTHLATFGHAVRSEVSRFVETVLAHQPERHELSQIVDGTHWLAGERECGRIGRDDAVLGQAASQTKPGHPECAVAVVLLRIEGGESGLRNPPRKVLGCSEALLLSRCGAFALGEQCTLFAAE